MPNGENVTSILEQSLQQLQKVEKRLRERLRDVEFKAQEYEDMAAELRIEIQALENSALKTKEVLESFKSSGFEEKSS